MNACFLDTSAVIDLFRRRDDVRRALEPYDVRFLPFVVLGELFSGAHQSRDPEEELTKLDDFLLTMPVFDGDQETARLYGEGFADLERRGCRIPTNDVWAAAVAVQYDLPLVSRDGHFGRMSGLRWVGY